LFDVVPQANEIVISDIKSRVILKVDKIAANVKALAMWRYFVFRLAGAAAD
jgi:hypothetical protein